jgi:hypothetical protein
LVEGLGKHSFLPNLAHGRSENGPVRVKVKAFAPMTWPND